MTETTQLTLSRMWLIRHGEPETDAQGRCYGRLDWGLSDRGQFQAQMAAQALSGEALAAVYSSPRRRARQSAEFLGKAKGLAVQILEGLCEIDFGDFEGLTYEEIEKQYPEQYQRWMTRPTEIHFPGGESFAQMQTRVIATSTKLCQRHQGQSIAIVSHGGVNRIILAEALGMPATHIFRIAQRYAGLNLVTHYEGVPTVELVNGFAKDADSA
ncbi:MAG: alpha-ribazole phosphatase [Acidobacteria bacterium]|nr:alpha-ribazole phosphatase [Acidobacteriota bacterium]